MSTPASPCRVKNCPNSTGRYHRGLCEVHYVEYGAKAKARTGWRKIARVSDLRGAVTHHPGNGPKVLVVDDDKDNRSMFVHLLRKIGQFDIRDTGNSLAAIQAVRDELPDIITTDVMRPVMDGLSTVEHIRKIEGAENVWVIMITANASLACMEEARAVGCDEYLFKPIDRESFREAIIRGLFNSSLDEQWVATTAARSVGEGLGELGVHILKAAGAVGRGLVRLGVAYVLKAGGCHCATCKARVMDRLRESIRAELLAWRAANPPGETVPEQEGESSDGKEPMQKAPSKDRKCIGSITNDGEERHCSGRIMDEFMNRLIPFSLCEKHFWDLIFGPSVQ